MHEAKNIATKMPQPRYSREDRAMPLYISIRIEFYNGIARFLCHSTAFLCSSTPTSATEITHSNADFQCRDVRHGDSENHATRLVKATMIVNIVIILQC